MNHIDCVIKRDVYPQKMHSCSKNIRAISIFVLKISVVYIEDNQMVIFDMKNISRECVVRRWKNECAARVFLTPYDASEWDIFHIKNNHLIILFIICLINIIIFNISIYKCLMTKKKKVLNYGRKWKWKLISSLVMISKFTTLGNSRISLLGI